MDAFQALEFTLMPPAPAFSIHHIHPILVNFTAALVPASVFSDLLGRMTGKLSLLHAAWWMIFYAAAVTPATALAGLMWKSEVQAVQPAGTLNLHQWIGTALAVLLIVVAWLRWRMHSRGEPPADWYFVLSGATTLALVYQGTLGGAMAFGP